MNTFAKLKDFFRSIRRIYWFFLGLIFIVGGGSFYYFTHFSSQAPLEYVLPIQKVAQQAITRIVTFRKQIKSNILQAKHILPKTFIVQPEQKIQQHHLPLKVHSSSEQSQSSQNNVMQEDESTKVLETKIRHLSHHLEGMQKKLIYLENVVQQLEKKLESIHEHSANKQSTADFEEENMHAQNMPLQTPVIPIESIHAIIPGRAWLNLQNGQMITASIGSYIPHYGTVRLIDAHQGFIQFNSGKVIYLNMQEY